MDSAGTWTSVHMLMEITNWETQHLQPKFYSFLNRYEWCKQYESILGHHDAKLDALSIKYVHGPLKSEYAYDELSRSGSLKLVVSSGNNAKLIHANVDAKLIHGNAGNGSRVSKLTIGYLFQIIWEIVRWLSAFRQ